MFPKRWVSFAVAALLAVAAIRPAHAVDFLYTWPPSSAIGLTGYGVYQSTGGGAYQLIAQVPLGALPNPQQPSYLVTGLQDDTTYYFASSAIATSGDSSLSYQSCITINTDVIACDFDDGDSGSYVYIHCFINAATARP
jgi:hypothetical protein